MLRAYKEAGVDRVMLLVPESANDIRAIVELADDSLAAGVEMG